MNPPYDFNAFESAAARALSERRVADAMRIYFFMSDGDPSLDGGTLGQKLGDCYHDLGEFAAAWYWYGRAIEENPGIFAETPEDRKERTSRATGPLPPEALLEEHPVTTRRRELAARLVFDDLLRPDEQQAVEFYAPAARLVEAGRDQDALRIYYFMADGDPHLDKGRLGRLIAERYDHLGLLSAAKYWYARASEENCNLDFGPTGDRWWELEDQVTIDDLFIPEDFRS